MGHESAGMPMEFLFPSTYSLYKGNALQELWHTRGWIFSTLSQANLPQDCPLHNLAQCSMIYRVCYRMNTSTLCGEPKERLNDMRHGLSGS